MLRTWPASPVTGPVLLVAGAASLFAGILHLTAAPVHFEERSDVGFFFLIVGVNQIVAGILLVIRPSLALIGATMLGTLGVIALYFVSRTTGVPFGPNPDHPEPVGSVDVVTTGMECLLVLLLAYLLGVDRAGIDDRSPEHQSAAGREGRGQGGVDGRAGGASAGPAPGMLLEQLDYRLIEADHDHALAEVGPRGRRSAAGDGLSNGALIALVDETATAICRRVVEQNGAAGSEATPVTVQVNAHLMRNDATGRLIADARLARHDGTLVVVETTVRDDQQETVGTVTSTHVIRSHAPTGRRRARRGASEAREPA